jgi:hypothetical protein
MDTGARETDEDAKFGGGPLGRRGAAVAASIIASDFLDLEELQTWVLILMKRRSREENGIVLWIESRDQPPTWPC